MDLKKETAGGVIKFTVKGDVGAMEARSFADSLVDSIPKTNPQIEIDLSECEFLCSNGLGALAAALMVARARGGDIVVTVASHNVRKLFDITALGSILKIRG
jgi:anti-anti-sigma factor